MGCEAHELPYRIEQKSDVLKLFNSLEDAIELSKARNIAKDKVVQDIENANPEFIYLTDDEKQMVEAMHKNA